MAPRLADRIAIITGASSGIGQAIALTYASEGATVVCSGLQPDSQTGQKKGRNQATHELIQAQGGKAVFVKADVTDETQVKALVAETVRQFGRLDM